VIAVSAARRPVALSTLAVAAIGVGVVFVVVGGPISLKPWPAVSNFATIFIAVFFQAVPFLVLGATVSAAIAALMPHGLLGRLLPKRAVFAVPVAALSGVALPGCECGSVPVAARLIQAGAPQAAAMTFLLAAPAVNPIVLVSTAVAFPGRPAMVLGRLLSGLLAATVVGWIWHRIEGKTAAVHSADSGHRRERWTTFVSTMRHDFVHTAGFLVLGAAMTAALQTLVPRSVLDRLGGSGIASIITMGLLAVVLSICSEADAFVAAGLSQFSLTSRLVFLTVGPMVDLKLIALQVGTFGRHFAVRFAPLTWIVAVASALVVGRVVL
jgi:uncharacterized protein